MNYDLASFSRGFFRNIPKQIRKLTVEHVNVEWFLLHLHHQLHLRVHLPALVWYSPLKWSILVEWDGRRWTRRFYCSI